MMTHSMDESTQHLVSLPVQAPAGEDGGRPHALVARLVDVHGADWVDAATLDAWGARGGDRVLLLAGDPVRHSEGLDVAVVLPELQRSFPGRFAIGVARRDAEDAIATRYGSRRWPALIFLRDGKYVTAIAGMLDWDDFIERVAQALQMPTSRPPSIGIAVVGAGVVPDSSCR